MRSIDAESLSDFPSRVAAFDERGIADGVNALNSQSLLGSLSDILRAGVTEARQAIIQIWVVPSATQSLLNNTSLVQSAYNSTIAQLPATASVSQLVTTLTDFWKSLVGK